MSSFQHQTLKRQAAERWESQTRTASCWKGKKEEELHNSANGTVRFKKKTANIQSWCQSTGGSYDVFWSTQLRELLNVKFRHLAWFHLRGDQVVLMAPSRLQWPRQQVGYVPLDLAILLYFLGVTIERANANSLCAQMRLQCGIPATKHGVNADVLRLLRSVPVFFALTCCSAWLALASTFVDQKRPTEKQEIFAGEENEWNSTFVSVISWN